MIRQSMRVPAGHSIRNLVILGIVLSLLLAVGENAQSIRIPSFGGSAANRIISPPSIGPAAPVAPAVVDVQNPPVQDVVPAVSAPKAPVVVDYHGTPWEPVKDGFDPSTIPVEEEFYDGHHTYSSVKGRYAWKILPHLEGLPVAVAATRDQADTDIVFVSFEADRYGAYILFSVNGERSFCKLDLLPAHIWAGKLRDHGDATDVRVVAHGEEIHLYGQDPRPGNHWWEKIEKRSELPCS